MFVIFMTFVQLWILLLLLLHDSTNRSHFETDALCGKGFQTYAKRSAVTVCA